MAYKAKSGRFKFPKINFKDNRVIAACVALGILLLIYGKKIFDKISSGLAFGSAKKDQAALVDETLNNSAGVRYTFVKGVVDTVFTEGDKPFYEDTDEKLMVNQMNLLQSAEEAVFASNYFMQSHGKSLKGYLKDKLNSDWRSGTTLIGKIVNPGAAGGSFANLVDVVKNNIL